MLLTEYVICIDEYVKGIDDICVDNKLKYKKTIKIKSMIIKMILIAYVLIIYNEYINQSLYFLYLNCIIDKYIYFQILSILSPSFLLILFVIHSRVTSVFITHPILSNYISYSFTLFYISNIYRYISYSSKYSYLPEILYPYKTTHHSI